MKIQVSIGKFLIDRLTQKYYESYSSQKLRSPCFYNNVSDVLNVADLVKSQNMSIAPKENNIENFESSKEKFFIKEDHKDEKHSDDEEDDKEDIEPPQDAHPGNIFATLAALQTGQMSLNQV